MSPTIGIKKLEERLTPVDIQADSMGAALRPVVETLVGGSGASAREESLTVSKEGEG